MNIHEAKDFLVQQTAEQALLEGVPLSDLERRMMYFTENGEMSEDPIALNHAFEAQCDTGEYESKIGKLMRHAFWRLKRENPQRASEWKSATKALSNEDHYLVVLWNAGATERPPYDSLKLLGTSVLVIVVAGTVIGAGGYISNRYGIHWPGARDPATRRSFPVWAQRTVLWLIVTGYFYYVVIPWITRASVPSLAELILKLVRRKSK